MGRPSRGKRVLADKTNVNRKSLQEQKKICVYSKEDSSKKQQDSDVYEFEFDSQEEPRGKIKKKRVRTQKPAVKRLKTSAKPLSRSRKSPPNKAVSHAIKPPPKPLGISNARTLPSIRPNFPAHVPAALRKDPLPIKKAVVQPAKSPVLISKPTPSSFAVTSTPAHGNDTDNFVCMSPEPSPCVRPDSPPLENLFDDDADQPIVSLPKPTRFEFNELAEARARVIRTSLTPRNVVPEPQPPPREPSPEPSRMKQTSILSFVRAPQEEGLFSCSTPLRLSEPEHCSMFSPVKDIEPHLDNTDVDVQEEAENENSNGSGEEDIASAPTRLSLNTLKQAIRANKETLTNELPPSPKRQFHRPPRKSYEKLSKKKALDFMELESEPESEIEDLFSNEEEVDQEQKKKKMPKKKKKENAISKAFEEWANKFNKELDDYEEFDLTVE